MSLIIIYFVLLSQSSETLYFTSSIGDYCFIKRINDTSIIISDLFEQTAIINPYLNDSFHKISLAINSDYQRNTFFILNNKVKYHVEVEEFLLLKITDLNSFTQTFTLIQNLRRQYFVYIFQCTNTLLCLLSQQSSTINLGIIKIGDLFLLDKIVFLELSYLEQCNNLTASNGSIFICCYSMNTYEYFYVLDLVQIVILNDKIIRINRIIHELGNTRIGQHFLEELNQNTMVFTKILTVISIILFNIQTMESIIDFTFPINLRDTVIHQAKLADNI